MGDDQVAPGQQGDDQGDAEDEFERGPEHAHELNQPERARDVPAVESLEEADLGFFAGKGAHQPCAGVVLLSLRADLGEAGLDALEAVVNSAAEVLHQHTGQRHRRPGHQGEPGADAEQEKQGEYGEEEGVGAVHQGGAEQHAHGAQVVGQPGHDVAGAIALIEARVLHFQLAEEVVAQVELDLPRDADENPALRVEKDALDQSDRGQQAGEDEDSLAGDAVAHGVDGSLDDLGKEHPDGVGRDAGERAPQVSPAVAAHVTVERGQIAEHGLIVRGAADSFHKAVASAASA
jgi:hypothetical protein